MTATDALRTEEAQVIALKMLTFLAEDSERFGRFLAVTGLGPSDFRRRAGEPSFLAFVADYLLADQSLLLAFAGNHALDPQTIVRLRRQLPGASDDS